MKHEYDFSKARRGRIFPKDSHKTEVRIELDKKLIEFLEKIIDQAGRGSIDSFINDAIREKLESGRSALLNNAGAKPQERTGPSSVPRALSRLTRLAVGNSTGSDDRITKDYPKNSGVKKTVRRVSK
jgi:hypothetical protein